MSTAHRPTWAPAQGRETQGTTKQYSSRDIAGQTKLKFRQPGQGTVDELRRRDLRLELERAEKRARNGGQGDDSGLADEDEQAAKRRKLIEAAIEQDKDDSEDDEPVKSNGATGEVAVSGASVNPRDADEDEDDDDDDDDSDDEDDTAALLRELEKIKRERADEKARQDAAKADADREDLESQIATGNPLLNLQAALNRTGSATPGPGATPGGFAVKRRWDDDVIFKNQARGATEKPQGTFVNDLLRTEFHRRFIKKFVA